MPSSNNTFYAMKTAREHVSEMGNRLERTRLANSPAELRSRFASAQADALDWAAFILKTHTLEAALKTISKKYLELERASK